MSQSGQAAAGELAWKQERERSSRCWILLLYGIAIRLGRGFARLILLPTVAYFLIVARAANVHSKNYLNKVLPRPAQRSDVAKHFFYFASTVLDRLYLYSGRLRDFELDLHGDEIFDQVLADGRGAILMLAHVGSFDALRLAAERRQNRLKIKVLMDLAQGSALNSVLKTINPVLLADIIDTSNDGGNVPLQVRDVLDEGALVGVMADRFTHPSEPFQMCDFLGQLAPFPVAPWNLAAALGRPIVFCICLYKGRNRYSLYFETIADLSAPIRRGQRRQQFVERRLQEFVGKLEAYVRRNPYNWFNFYDFWAPPGGGSFFDSSRSDGPAS